MTIFDISTNPDRVPFAPVLRALSEIARAADVSMLVVGATARDVALAADGHTAAQRATNDVDIGVAVVDAAAFESLVADLEALTPGHPHKFRVEGVEVDIIPFGGVERDDRTISRPDGSTMNMLGFAEAMDSALHVRIADELTVAVASLSAQTALKIFAWADRGHWTDRDAVDLRTLLHGYSDGGVRLDNIYAEDRLGVLSNYDFEVRHAGAHWLGADVRRDLGKTVATRCAALVDVDENDRQRLPAAMRGDIAENVRILAALRNGLRA